MRIEQRTPTQLWIQAYPIATWLVGSVLAAIGLIVLGSHVLHLTTSTATGLISDATFGSLFLLTGAIALLRGRILRACLDKEEAVLTLSRQGWLRVETETLPLYAIRAVRLETPQRATPGEDAATPEAAVANPATAPAAVSAPSPPEPSPLLLPNLVTPRSANASLNQYRVVLELEPSLARSVTLYTAARREQPQAIAEQVAQFLGIEAEISPGVTDLLRGLWQSVRSSQATTTEPDTESAESAPLESKR